MSWASSWLKAPRTEIATHNAGERPLRPSVIFRRVTNGFRSLGGAKVYADLRSIVETGRRDGRSPLIAIRVALTARSEPAIPLRLNFCRFFCYR